MTGLNIDKYVLVDTETIADLVNAIGGVKFNVPIDMDYDDETQNLHIHLKAGEQIIDGDKAEQLLRFRHNSDGTSYSAEYGDNDFGRMRTQREFIMETARRFLKIENISKATNLLSIVSKNVITNMDFKELKYYIPYAFKFNTSNISTGVLPGVSNEYNGVSLYIVDTKQSKSVIENLFIDKVLDEVD